MYRFNALSNAILLLTVVLSLPELLLEAGDLPSDKSDSKVTRDEHNESYILFGTKTAYKALENKNLWTWKPNGCEVVQLNMVFRHGTRTPISREIEKFEELSTVVNRLIVNSTGVDNRVDIRFPWRNKYSSNEIKFLIREGERELFGIGRRFAQRFSELPTRPLSEFKFFSTNETRSIKSALAFIKGYFGRTLESNFIDAENLPLTSLPVYNDSLLRYYESCPKYAREVRDNRTSFNEKDKFLYGPEVESVVRKVRLRLGLDGYEEFNADRVFSMYVECSYSVAIYGISINSGWCSVFDIDDLKIMEYVLDLKTYYRHGPFYPITYDISCNLLKDILRSIQAVADRPVLYPKYSGIFRSGHSRTLLPLFAKMGLFKDDITLTARNFKELKKRRFKPGRMAGFGGNLAFVVYKCQNRSHILQAYSNERLVKIPCCASKYQCSLEEFERCYEPHVETCDFDRLCER